MKDTFCASVPDSSTNYSQVLLKPEGKRAPATTFKTQSTQGRPSAGAASTRSAAQSRSPQTSAPALGSSVEGKSECCLRKKREGGREAGRGRGGERRRTERDPHGGEETRRHRERQSQSGGSLKRGLPARSQCLLSLAASPFPFPGWLPSSPCLPGRLEGPSHHSVQPQQHLASTPRAAQGQHPKSTCTATTANTGLQSL